MLISLNNKSRIDFLTCATYFLQLFIYDYIGNVSLGVNILLLLIAGSLVNGPYALITTAVSAELGTHSSLGDNSKALATVTAIIDGTGSIGAAVGPLLAGLIYTQAGWHSVFYILMCSDLLALLVSIDLSDPLCLHKNDNFIYLYCFIVSASVQISLQRLEIIRAKTKSCSNLNSEIMLMLDNCVSFKFK